MPDDLAGQFTDGGRIPVLKLYINDAKSRSLEWTSRSRWWNPDLVKAKKRRYYGDTDLHLYSALEKHGVLDKDVVILGSESPWYECICTYYGARVTTIEYREVNCSIPGLTVMTPDTFAKDPTTFDVAVSISSIEHSGLGRYGDPINPRGDLDAMREFRRLLKPDGYLILAVPIGQDALVWNAHRIYGRKRFPVLIDGWEVVDSFGFDEAQFDLPLGTWNVQPVWVLKQSSTEKCDVTSSA